MEKLRVVDFKDDWFILESKTDPKCRCKVSDIRLHDTKPTMNMEVEWISKGSYTNGQRKKMLARTVIGLLRSAVEHQKKLDKHSKGQS